MDEKERNMLVYGIREKNSSPLRRATPSQPRKQEPVVNCTAEDS